MTRTFAGCVTLALVMSLTAAGSAGGQSVTSPRIGLALSGGGARGIAHVGVLKVLDEMRIPISCVTGTSMGSIVGGTFAAGRTPAEMEKLVLETDWNEVFRDKPPRKEIAIRRKVDDYKTLFAPELGITDNGAALPKGVLAGVAIESYFRTLATPAFGVTDFTKLPIPFRAVATDIETGQEVVLDHGNLAEAMRASMSVPGAMTPVQIDGRLLVDGGIANNLPIDLARKLCNADVIIAVNISTPPLKRSEITSALSVVGQLVNFLGKQSVDDQLKSLGDNDVLIAPDLGDISAGTFERSKDAIKVGEDATRAMAGKLERYSVPAEQYAALRSTQVREAKALGTVDEIRVEGLTRTNPAVVRELIESKPGEPLSEEKLGADLRRVFGTRDYETINYRIVGGELGPRALVIQPTEKAWGPNYLRFGLGIASDNHGNNQFNALVQYRKTWLNSLGGELLVEGQVGQDTHLFGEFFQPLTQSGNWFVAPNALVGRQTRGVFVGDDQVAEYMIDVAQAGLDFGRVLGTWGQLRVGAVWSHVDAKVDVGSPILPSLEQTTAGPRVALFVDQQDRAYFPSDGYTFLGTAYAG
jgi:NTE family protein